MKKKAMIIGVIIAIFVIITAVSSCYCVKEDEYAYVVRFSKIERIERAAGLHFKIPFIDSENFSRKTSSFMILRPPMF